MARIATIIAIIPIIFFLSFITSPSTSQTFSVSILLLFSLFDKCFFLFYDGFIQSIRKEGFYGKFFQKLFSKPKEVDSDDDILDNWVSFEDSLDRSPEYPVSQYEAFQIAKQYLPNDFVSRDKRAITYLSLHKATIVLQEDQSVWDIHITDGEISWSEKDGTLCDGVLVKKDFSKLHCLVSTQDGTYYYLDK